MARLPDENDIGFSMPSSQSVVGGPRDFIGPAVRRGLDVIESENTANRALDRQKRAERDSLDLTRARADWQTRRANEGNLYQYDNDQDYPTWKPRYEKHVLKHRDSSAALIGNPRLRAKFEAEAQADIAADALDIDNRARKIDRDKRVTEGLTSIDRQMGAAATLPGPEADKVIDQARANIDNMAASGLITPAQAIEKRQRAVEEYAAIRANRDVDERPGITQQWLSGQDITGAEGLIADVEDFRAEPYMDKGSWRVGFGSDTITTEEGRVIKVKPGMRVTRADALRDLKRRRVEFQDTIIKQVGADAWAKLPENARDGLTSFGYNYGSLTPSLVGAVKGGDIKMIAQAVRDRAVDNEGENAKRREREARVIEGTEQAVTKRPDYYDFLTPAARAALQGKTETAIGQRDQEIVQAERQARTDAALQASQRKGELDLGIEQGQVSREMILNDPVIDAGDKAVLIRRWDQREEENTTATAVWQAIQTGEPLPDKADKGLDAIFKGVGGAAALAKNDPKAVGAVAYLWDKAQAIPPAAKRTINSMIRSGSQDSMISGLAILDQLQRQNPVAFDKEFDGATAKALTYYQDRIGYAAPEEIYKGLRERSDPAIVKAREPLVAKGTKEAIENYDADKIAGMFDQSILPFTAPSMAEGSVKGKILDSALIEQDYARAYGEAYADDPANAEKNALSMLQRKWGQSPTNGGKVMRYPPERYTPDVFGEPDWRTEVLENDLRKLGYTVQQSAWVTETQKRNKGKPGWEPKPEPVRNYVIQPIPMTESDIAAGVSPHYAIIVQNPKTGEWDSALDKDGVPVAYQWTAEDARPFQERARQKFRARERREDDRKTRARQALDQEGFMMIPEPPEGLQ